MAGHSSSGGAMLGDALVLDLQNRSSPWLPFCYSLYSFAPPIRYAHKQKKWLPDVVSDSTPKIWVGLSSSPSLCYELLDTLVVLASAGINANLVAGVDE